MHRKTEGAVDVVLWLLLILSLIYALNLFVWVSLFGWTVDGALFGLLVLVLPVATALSIYRRRKSGRSQLRSVDAALGASSTVLIGMLLVFVYARWA